jgi:hypothetical protein
VNTFRENLEPLGNYLSEGTKNNLWKRTPAPAGTLNVELDFYLLL